MNARQKKISLILDVRMEILRPLTNNGSVRFAMDQMKDILLNFLPNVVSNCGNIREKRTCRL